MNGSVPCKHCEKIIYSTDKYVTESFRRRGETFRTYYFFCKNECYYAWREEIIKIAKEEKTAMFPTSITKLLEDLSNSGTSSISIRPYSLGNDEHGISVFLHFVFSVSDENLEKQLPAWTANIQRVDRKKTMTLVYLRIPKESSPELFDEVREFTQPDQKITDKIEKKEAKVRILQDDIYRLHTESYEEQAKRLRERYPCKIYVSIRA